MCGSPYAPVVEPVDEAPCPSCGEARSSQRSLSPALLEGSSHGDFGAPPLGATLPVTVESRPTEEPEDDPPPPEGFGPYRVVGVIGRGGMGVVYLCRHETTGAEVAVKTVRVRKQALLQRIRREIHAMARIRHPGLVRIIATGQSGGVPWHAMELIRGRTLHEHLRKLRPPPGPTKNIRVGEVGSSADFILVNEPTVAEPEGSEALESEVFSLPDTTGVSETVRLPPMETQFQPPGPDDDPVPSGLQPRTQNDLPTTDLKRPGPTEPPPRPRTGLEGSTRPRVAPDPDRLTILGMVARLCRTLEYLHGEGIVHRDLKPQNIVVRADGTPVLLDFGLASYFGVEGRELLDVAGRVEGTPEYMSPEQVRGEYVDARADLYAIGCLLYQAVTGRVPFRSGSASATLRAHVKTRPIPPSELFDGVPRPLEELILRLLSKEKADRLGHARDVTRALEAAGIPGPGEWAADLQARDYLYRPGFVGRDAVLDGLEERIRKDLKRPGRCLFVRGPSGVGKTRVILELARRLEIGGLAVVAGECQPVGVGVGGERDGLGIRSAPLHPFRPVLQAIADACIERGADEAERILGPRARILADVEPCLAQVPGLGNHPEPPSIGDDASRYRQIEALGETLAEFSSIAPLVVVIDDLQWADDLTLNFLALFHVGAWDVPTVAIAAAYRAEEDPTLRKYKRIFEDAEVIDLEPLEESSVARIIRDMLGTSNPGDELVRHLASRSRGNPFFVAEFLRAAVAERFLRRDEDGRWSSRVVQDESGEPEGLRTAIPLPDSLHDLITRRLDRLSDDARQLAGLAAVIGRWVDPRLLDAVGLLDETRSMHAVEELLVAQVLEEERDGTLRFAHDKLREVAYARVEPGERRELHRAAALAIEARAQGPDDLTRLSSTMAHHWYHAIGDREREPDRVARAVDLLEKSAAHAMNTGLPGEAVEFGRAAARLLGLELPEATTEIAEAMGDEIERIHQALQGRAPGELIDLPESTDPATDRLIALVLTILPPAYLSNKFGLFSLMAAKCLSLTLERGMGPMGASVFAFYAIVARIIGDDSRLAREFSRLAIALDERTGCRQSAVVLFIDAWFIRHWNSPVGEGLSRCLAGAEAGLGGGQVLFGCYNLGTYVVLLAASGERLDRVIAAADERIALVGHRVLVARFHCVLERQFARALRGQTESPGSFGDGDYDEARDLAFITRTTNSNQVGYYHVARLKLLYYLGRTDEAVEASNKALAVWDSFARQPAEVDLALFRALALLAEAKSVTSEGVRAARTHLDTLTRWRADCEANFGHKALLVEAELARVEGRNDQAAGLYEQAALEAATHGFLPHVALARELSGRHQARLGQTDRARAEFEAAAEAYLAWGADLLAGRIKRAIADLNVRPGTDA